MASANAKPRRGPLRYLSRALAVLLLGLFVALLVYGLLSKAADTTIDSSLADAKAPAAPAFELEMLERGTPGSPLAGTLRSAAADGRIALAELRGTPVVLNFWASWCPPCREEAPRLERRWRAARVDGVLFLGLDMQDLSGDARDFLDEFRTSYPTIRDRGDDVAREWGVTGLPETFFVSARGRVVGHVIGAVSSRQLDAGIRAAVNGRPAPAREGGERRSMR
jgi:cytochrome c biogenesis protein CcmG, thiol:disulfide interchange protein DsbE